MCEFFVTADPILYESRAHSARIHGVHTSIRLKNLVWDTLAILAADENMTTNALIVQSHDEILHHRDDIQDFMSSLRVTYLRCLRRRYDQLEAAQQAKGVVRV